MAQHKKWILILPLLLVLLVLAGLHLRSSEKKAPPSDELAINHDANTIEYGDTTVNAKTLSEGINGTITSYPDLDVYQLGDQTLTYTIRQQDGEEKIQIHVQIVDTQKPDIILKKERISIDYGTSYDILKNIVSISDPVDGPLTYMEGKETKPGCYSIQGKLDETKSGDQKIRIQAIDQNGNRTTRSFTINVKQEEAEEINVEKHAS